MAGCGLCKKDSLLRVLSGTVDGLQVGKNKRDKNQSPSRYQKSATISVPNQYLNKLTKWNVLIFCYIIKVTNTEEEGVIVTSIGDKSFTGQPP